LFHFGCLALATHQSATKYACPTGLQPIALTDELQELARCPNTLFVDALFVAACKNGLTKLVNKLIKTHTFTNMVVGAGFACATHAGHKAVLELLLENSLLAYDSNIICLGIAIQHKNMEMVRYWSRLCSEEDHDFAHQITTEYLDLETYKHLVKEAGSETYNSTTCLYKAIRLGNQDLALHIVNSYVYLDDWMKFKYRWEKFGRIIPIIYEQTCWACMWGNLEVLKLMVEKRFYLDLYDNLALTCAHFMGHEEVELYLKSKGCQLATESLFYNLADSCANSDMSKLKQYISGWKRHERREIHDFVLGFILILLIRNRNVSMIKYLLSQCRSTFTYGIRRGFEYALQLNLLPILCTFMDRFSFTIYYVIARGSLLNDGNMIEEGLARLVKKGRNNSGRKAKSIIFNYGMIFQNPRLLALVKRYF
jgi:hypothetical protein